MGRLRKIILIVTVLGLIGVIIVLTATPGSVMTEKAASGEPTNKEGVIALLGLLILGYMAMGLDFRDWF